MWGRWKCRRVRGLLWNYAAQRLPEAHSERVERHLRGCTSCAAQAEEIAQTVRLLADYRAQTVPSSETSWQAVRMRLAAQTLPAVATRPDRRAPLLAWSGAALAVVAFALLSGALWQALTHGREADGLLSANGHRNTKDTHPPSPPVAALPSYSSVRQSSFDPHSKNQKDHALIASGAGSAAVRSIDTIPPAQKETPHALHKSKRGRILTHLQRRSESLRALWRAQMARIAAVQKARLAREEARMAAERERILSALLQTVDGDRPVHLAAQTDFVMAELVDPSHAQPARYYVMNSIPADARPERPATFTGNAEETQVW